MIVRACTSPRTLSCTHFPPLGFTFTDVPPAHDSLTARPPPIVSYARTLRFYFQLPNGTLNQGSSSVRRAGAGRPPQDVARDRPRRRRPQEPQERLHLAPPREPVFTIHSGLQIAYCLLEKFASVLTVDLPLHPAASAMDAEGQVRLIHFF